VPKWIIALAVAIAIVVVQYRGERRTRIPVIAVAIRALALTLAFALALDAPRGLARGAAPLVVFDASASWRRAHPDSVWQAALSRARAAAGIDTLWLAGDSLRPAGNAVFPDDNASHIEPAVDRALGSGRALFVVTDGDIDDPHVLDRLLTGSRIDVPQAPSLPDAAIVAIEAPRSAVAGDTIEIAVRLIAGGAGAPAGSLTIHVDGVLAARVPVDTFAPFAEREARARVRIGDVREHRVIGASLNLAGDAVATNDSLAAAIEVVATPRAVFVSTSPDQDSRFALEVLRGTLSIAVRAYYRVAPGTWRQEPGFTPATEGAVREALATAPIAILHGDTALFGAPRAVTAGGLALLVPAPPGSTDEWYAVAPPVSPLSSSLAGIPWDSLAPVSLSSPVRGDWTALAARRPRTQRDERALVAGTDRPRRTIVVGGSGYWRWRFRGGVSADAYTALFGGVFDWLAAGGDDRRAVVPATAWSRAGEPIQWRRGARRDSLVTVMLRAEGGGRADSVKLRFPGEASTAESPPLAQGAYDVTMPGGRAQIVVGPSREWLPRRASVSSGSVGSTRIAGQAPRLRDAWWAYIVVAAALCTEWLLRRRAGLR
jgi:hypothetical protein